MAPEKLFPMLYDPATHRVAGMGWQEAFGGTPEIVTHFAEPVTDCDEAKQMRRYWATESVWMQIARAVNPEPSLPMYMLGLPVTYKTFAEDFDDAITFRHGYRYKSTPRTPTPPV